jgi:hypothetical protein
VPTLFDNIGTPLNLLPVYEPFLPEKERQKSSPISPTDPEDSRSIHLMKRRIRRKVRKKKEKYFNTGGFATPKQELSVAKINAYKHLLNIAIIMKIIYNINFKKILEQIRGVSKNVRK